MFLVELTSTPTADLPLDAFKAHLLLGRGFSDDGLQDEVLESYLRASIAAIETRIGKMLLIRRVSWTVTRWTRETAQPLPVAPVSVVHSVVLTDASGAETSVAPERFVLRPDTHRPLIKAISGCLPDIPDSGSATMSFDAGFSAVWTGVPADLREAVFLLAAHYYDNRRDTTGAGGLMPFGVMGLLEPHRNIRLFGGAA